ncbi:MAG: IS21 family transposase [Chloroflexi bacterium]|nr:IS21 family transposase [Chloroflexota bacterium]
MHYLRELVHQLRAGRSQRAIAQDLGLARMTVQKYAQLAAAAGYLDAVRPLPEAAELLQRLGPAAPPPRTPSTVEPYRAQVEHLLEAGVEQMTIFDRLRERGYTGSYSSIRRFVRTLRPPMPKAVVRVHTAPGEEAQVDFGSAGTLLDPRNQQPRRAWIFVMTLGYSRHQYAELVFDQKISTWLSCHRHAFEWFGGIPHRIVLDNLKAAILEAHLHDPVVGEAYRRQAQHYGFVISPNRPYTPEHKGKVENGVHFVKRSFLAGQQFADLHVANAALRQWITERAGVRDHGTTHRPPLAVFVAEEQLHLQPLPRTPFELVEIKRAKVHPDCHAVLDGSYYSAPYRYVGQALDAWIFAHVVQFFDGPELVTTHPRAHQRGQWLTRTEHYPPHKAAYLERTPAYCRRLALTIGPATSEVVELLLAERPLDRLRSVQALLRLLDQVGKTRLEAACQRALHFGDVRYRRIKDILNAALDQQPVPTTPSAVIHTASFTFERSADEFFDVVNDGAA